jgi:hypothetical protein
MSRSTYLYLAVVLGLFCYVAFIDKKIPGTKEREDAATKVFTLNPDDVNGLEVSNEHGVYICQKIDGRWEIKKPVQTPGDGATLDGMVDQIAFTQPQRLIDIDDSSETDLSHLKEWGLIPPIDRLIIHTKDKQFVLLVGRKLAINDSVYARASEHKNEPVRILPATVKDLLDKDLSALRSRNVFDFNQDNVEKIATHTSSPAATPGQGQDCEIDQKDGNWTMQLPLVARANGTAVPGVIGKILGLRVVDFVVDDASNLSTYGLTSPSASITVGLKGTDGKPSEDMALQVGGPVPNKPDQVYAQRLKSNSVFTLNASILNDVLTSLPGVRDHHVIPFDVNKPTGLSYTIGPKKISVKSDHAFWNCVVDAPGAADPTKVNQLLQLISRLESTPVMKDSVPDLKPYGLDKPAGKITIESPEFKPGMSATLYIGKTEANAIYVRNSFEPFVYTVPANAFDSLPASNLALRDPRAIDLKFDQLKSMTITAAGTPSVTLLRSTGGTWSAANVKDRMVDANQADPQASLFCQLQAKSWLGPALPAYGLAKPLLTIAVLADEPKPTVLRIGAQLPDGTHAAQIEGDPTVFALADADYGVLNASSLEPIPKELPATNAPSAKAPATNAPSAK